jgi:WD40 repeat protein
MPPIQLLVHEGDARRLQTELTGPLELGRQRSSEPEPSAETPCPLLPATSSGPARLIIAGNRESNVSRQHALLEPLPSGLVRVHNLTQVPLVHDHGSLAPGTTADFTPPFSLDLLPRRISVVPAAQDSADEHGVKGLEEQTIGTGTLSELSARLRQPPPLHQISSACSRRISPLWTTRSLSKGHRGRLFQAVSSPVWQPRQLWRKPWHRCGACVIIPERIVSHPKRQPMSDQDAAGPDDATRFTTAQPPADPDATRFNAVPAADSDETHFGASSLPGTAPTPPGSVSPASRDRRLPRRFAGYVLLEEIARGGMGVVYKAHQLGPDGRPLRLVALKMVLGGSEATPEVTQRFWNEARAAAGLNHPGIVPVVEAGDHEGQPFYSMEFIEGGSLAERVQAGGPLPPQEAARLLRQVAEAVQAAHEQGIIHRDIKPANILLAAPREGGTVARLTDFGLARTREGAGSLTGEKLGTPSYMAPEQAAGKVHAVSAATDVYGLGAVLYCLLTGRPPFQSSSPLETMRLVLEQEPVPVRQLNPAVPRDLETVCHRCLQKEPARRYPAAGDVAAELGRFLAGDPVRARPVGRLERTWRWCGRNPVVAGLLTAVLLLLLAGTSVGWVLAVRARVSERQALKEKDRADREAREADEARKRAEEGERAAKFEQKKAEFVAYAFRLREAQAELKQGRPQRVWAIPSQCDPTLCRWEHEYLLRRALRLGEAQPDQEALVLQGHADGALDVCVSPDGKRIASASADRLVKVWDAVTGQEVRSFRGHTDSVTGVCFSPDGRQVASSGADDTLRIWDAGSGREIHCLRGHRDSALCVRFSPGGRRLASGGGDGTVRLWDAATGQETLTLRGHAGPVYHVAFSPEGNHLASAGYDRTARVWNALTGREILSLRGHTDSVYAVCFSPDGRRLATGSRDRKVRLWDPATGKELLPPLRGHTGSVERVCFSPDGRRLASASSDNSVRVWDTFTGQEALTLPGHSRGVLGVCFSPDGKRLLSAGNDRAVKVWDATTGEETLTLKGHTGPVLSVCFHPDGNRIASGSYDRTVKVWDSERGEAAATFGGDNDSVLCLQFSPDGKYLVTSSGDKTAKVRDVATGKEIASFVGHLRPVYGVCFSPDGRRLASVSGDMTVRLWDAHTGQEQFKLQGHKGPVWCVDFSPDGRHVASGSVDRRVTVWDLSTRKAAFSLAGHTDSVTSVSFSPDGRRLASASQDRTVRVWDLSTGREQFALKGHTDRVLSVCFSPEGRRLVSAGHDRTVRDWDAVTGKETATLRGHIEAVHSACYSPDGKHLASGSSDNTVKVWDARKPAVAKRP